MKSFIISEEEKKRILNLHESRSKNLYLINESDDSKFVVDHKYELGRGDGLDITLNAGQSFKKTDNQKYNAVLTAPLINWGGEGIGITSKYGHPFKPEGTAERLEFYCNSTKSKSVYEDDSKLHLVVANSSEDGSELEYLYFSLYNNELEKKLSEKFC